MIPLLIATARSGSSIISNLMYQLGKNEIGYKNYLNEFFTVTQLYKPSYQTIDNIIQQIECPRVNCIWYDSARKERLKRLELIKHDACYALKVFPEDLEPEILDFIEKNYTIIGLERRDKENQFISFNHMMNTNVASYNVNDNTVINSVRVEIKHLIPFIQHITNFRKLQKTLKFPIIYYEDFTKAENKSKFLCDHFGIKYNPTELIIESKETPYIKSKKEIIENEKEWNIIRLNLEKLSSILE